MNFIEKSENLSTKSIFLSITGKPNVGKSSLMNMLLNSKVSIVSPKAQTTRDRVNGVLTEGDTQIVFTDTPGILKPKTSLDEYMNKEIHETVSDADASLHVVEANKRFCSSDEKVISELKTLNMPTILVINKIDTVKNKSNLIAQMKEFMDGFPYKAIVPVSAKTGEGRDVLLQEIKKLAVPSVFYFPEDRVTDRGYDRMVSEIIREKILRFMNEEIPHGVAVYVDSLNKRKNGLIDISATIFCERDSHKGIIIGKNGDMLKKVGSYAREDIEDFLNSKVNLKIWVKVKEDWKNRESLLKSWGYSI